MSKFQDKLDLPKITRSQGKSARVDSGLTEGEVALATSKEDRPLPPEISWSGDGGGLGRSSTVGQMPDNGRLLRALAEQIKLPLIQILRQTELAGIESDVFLSDINLQADMALRLIDNYLLSTMLIDRQQQLALEPASVSSILYDTAHRLSGIAAQYNCTIDLHLPGKYQPVMVHPQSFEAALTTLGYSFIEAQQLENAHQKPVVTLAAHKSRYGVVAGVYGDQEGLSTAIYRRAHSLYGKARQPLPSMSSSSGAGIFLADSLLNAMSTKLHVSHHHKLNGLAATLLPSSQLRFV